MKNFDFKISMEIFCLPEPILTIFGITNMCVCGYKRMFVSCITQKRLVVEY
ncbi:hypothetical protein O3M35_011459 [Rhynocoris fuscipes]|uniref:Uncharacterized protein n=1 Tax=Rhynocoris fuscipes TaxID=488301 RepID=A0AAW1D2G7_9HEMI